MSKSKNYLPTPKSFATNAIHYNQDPDDWNCLPLVTPLVTSTTFKQLTPGEPKQFSYGRYNNPSRELLEKCLAKLEDAEYGVCFASGSGAITAICHTLKQNDHVIYVDDVYSDTSSIFNEIMTKHGLTFTEIDGYNVEDIHEIVNPKTKIIWIETPTNPTLKVIDIRAIAEVAKRHHLLLIVDNTFLTPYFQKPLNFGADIVLHSLSKYINGHSDVVMGAILTNDIQIYEQLKYLQKSLGIVPSPFDCYQVIRGLKTLALRMEKHMENSLIIGKYLEQHPKIEKVLHPGLPSHPQHELFKSQTSGCGGMLSFYLKGGLNESKTFLSSLKIFTLAESLGNSESLAQLPSIMTHASVPEQRRKILKISDNLIRLSVGLEDADDLIDDLRQALEKI